MSDHAHKYYSHSHNTAENHSHWNEAASSYNSKFAKSIQQIIDEIQKHHGWIGVDWAEDSDSEDGGSPASASASAKKSVRLLDYACGTGLVSRALAPYVTQSIGVDLTEGMVQVYNTSARNQGIPETEMLAVQGNLLAADRPSPPELAGAEFFDFDIAAVGMGFHHFDDPATAARRLAERLKKGGVLFIVDFLPHQHLHMDDDYGEKAAKTVTHMGFSHEEVRKMFEDAGVGADFDYKVIGTGVVVDAGEKRSVFFAKGTKL